MCKCNRKLEKRTYTETISNEDDKIKDHLMRESKKTCNIEGKQFFLT